MKTKNQLIKYINHRFNGYLDKSKTSYYNVNKSREVWRQNIQQLIFMSDVYLYNKEANISHAGFGVQLANKPFCIG